MRQTIQGLLFSLCIAFGANIYACCSVEDNCDPCISCDTCMPTGDGHPFFSIRSQSWNAARQLVGWQNLIHRFEEDNWYAAFSITPQYTRSFRPCQIAPYFFGNDLENGQLTISGSRRGVIDTSLAGNGDEGYGAVVRQEHEWLADYFGLPTDFVSKVSFRPHVKTFLVDFDLFIGLNNVSEGLFLRVHAPLVHTKWSLNMCEKTEHEGTFSFNMGYMAEEEVTVKNPEGERILPKNFTAAMKGVTWGDMQDPLKYGKIDCCELDKTALSDIHVSFGWNFVQEPKQHLGLFLHLGFPTGGKPKAVYLFEPMIGNGGHFELGLGMTGHSQLWEDEDEDRFLAVHGEVRAAHLFRRMQMRSFDLKGKPNSRYMLISEFNSPSEGLIVTGYLGDPPDFEERAQEPSRQYQKNLFPLINKSTCCTDVSIGVQAELAIKLAYTRGRFSFDLGYNFWGRSGEKFHLCNSCDKSACKITENRYALKGDAFMYGFDFPVPTALSATQSLADIHSGRNTPPGNRFLGTQTRSSESTVILSDAQNFGVDDLKETALEYISFSTAGLFRPRTQHTSANPIYIQSSDLDTSETPSAFSHKIFLHMNYTHKKDEEDDLIPFFGVGAEIEFAGRSNNTFAALSKWGVWCKGGLSFH